jgi:hypothetical protein
MSTFTAFDATGKILEESGRIMIQFGWSRVGESGGEPPGPERFACEFGDEDRWLA